jgi:hypothetical protein
MISIFLQGSYVTMEQHALKNENNGFCYLETSGGQISNPHLNAAHFFNKIVN